MTHLVVVEWIKVLDDLKRPPSEQERQKLRAWLAEDPQHLDAFLEGVHNMMYLYDSTERPRESNPRYRHFIVEATRAQVGLKRTAARR